MFSRRRFLMTLAAAATSSAGGASANAKTGSGFGALKPDDGDILDLPDGFEYTVVARHNDEMSDGLLFPGEADGMAAFPRADGNVVLVCNHENRPIERRFSPFGAENERLARFDSSKLYDRGNGRTPGLGGTTTIVYDPKKRVTVSQHLSLAGTENNCSGGATPWGSWLSCEEAFEDPGPAFRLGSPVERERRHGYVFEVPAASKTPVEPLPITAMGRYEHEAAAVDPKSGAVYLTEDRHRSLFYRYLPDVPQKLAAGGRLQALAVFESPAYDTRNWSSEQWMRPMEWHQCEWIDLDDVDTDVDDLRFRGFERGAARFARGEGLCYSNGSVFMTCTIGGPARLGQVFEYRLGENNDAPGALRLVAESGPRSLLRHCDNIAMSPWGDLIICEDTTDHCGLVGMTPGGRQYALADNAYTPSELAGLCFSPDGTTMFVNIQHRGLTLAITGPWPLVSDLAA